MATLTETAYYSRLIIKWGGIFLLFLMIGRMSWGMAVRWWKLLHPKPLPVPTMGFNRLPDLNFTSPAATEVTYTLQLPTGTYPEFGDRAKVYAMGEVAPNLIALERAKETAKRMGFKNEPKGLSDMLFQWTETQPPTSTLEMMIFTGVFTYKRDWFTQVDFLSEKQFETEARTIELVKSFLQQAQLLQDDLKNGEAKVSYLKANAGAYRETVSLSEADFVRVDLFRATIDKVYQIMTQNPDKGLVRGIVAGNKNVKLVLLDYAYFPVDYTNSQTYWIKRPETAYAELTSGKGFVARLKPEVNQVTVRRVELGYFDSQAPQKYLQPIYIFRGDDNFIGYVPAVTYENPNQTQK